MKTKISIIIMIIFLLTGCYDNKELNKIAILTATEINKIDEEYIVNAEVINPQAPDKTTNSQSPYIIYTGKGKTISEAYRQIKTSAPRYLYPEHLQILIINENIAKNNITEILDFYLRNPLIRTEFNVLIGKDNNVLSTTTPIDEISSTSILNTLKTNNKYLGRSNLVTLNDFASASINPNIEIVLPSIKIKDKDKFANNIENTKSTIINNTYELGNLAIFKNNKLLGYLTNDESITYNLIKNNTKNSIITYNCQKDEYLTLEIITSKSTIKVNNDNIKINVNMDTAINENNCHINLNNVTAINNLEKDLSSYLNKELSNNINNIRNKYNSDIFGFLDEIYKHNYKQYLKVKDNWYDFQYKNIKIKLNTNINIISNGTTMEAPNEKN